jgi:signal transduction histidine kinase
VEDSGPGIPPEIVSRIFDPFFTTRDVGRGSGLGLYIVAEIVRQHQGCIGVTSEPGRGTRFLIKLPVDAPAGAGNAGTEA